MITARTLRRLQATALQNGGFHPTDMPTLVEWDISGRCERPRYRMLHARGEVSHNRKWLTNPGTASVRLWVPCRMCPPCLRVKSAQWRSRASIEINRSARTWFGTFTLRPEEHHLAWMRICKAARQQNCGVLPPIDVVDAFRLRAADMGKMLTKYFKRVRDAHACSLKYLLVCERHESGLPHFHCLIHERDAPVPYRSLQEQWPYGFTHFKLVEDGKKASRYVAKYISKDVVGRVRASQRYGQISAVSDSEV